MDDLLLEHIKRLEDSLSNRYTLGNLSSWISKNTYIEGRKLSYTDREYQVDILDDPAKELYVMKCAQVGLSELLARWALACAVTQPNFTVIYTFPAANDAQLFAKTRLGPIIDGSRVIQASISKAVDGAEVKKFGENSFLYTRGTFSETGALSVPADLLIHDEIDRSDMDNVSAYVSRLQDRPTKMRRMFSTPTASKFGIDLLSLTSKRKRQMWTCSCCGYKFLPTYHHDVHIPGFDGDKREINSTSIKNIDWANAVLLCPSCGKVPSSDVRYREWVVENSEENYDAVTYCVTPFCAPNRITVPYLVQASAKFGKWSEFCNQALGETSEDAEDVLTQEDIRVASIGCSLDSSELHYLGMDVGVTCHITIGRLTQDGKLLVVHREKVSYLQVEERRRELCAMYRVVLSVHDLLPYTPIIASITALDPNAFGAQFFDSPSTELFRVREQVEDPEKGKINIRTAMINRSGAFDSLMDMFKKRKVVVRGVDDEYVSQLTDMKRIQKLDRFNTMRFHWQKSKAGNDHWHHSLLYLYIATHMRALAGFWTNAGAVELVSKFTPKVEDERLSFWGRRA